MDEQAKIMTCLDLFFGSENNVNFEIWVEEIVSFFSDYNTQFNFIGITGNGYSGKYTRYKRGIKKIGGVGIEGVSLLYSEDFDSPAFNWSIYISYYIKNIGNKMSCYIDSSFIKRGSNFPRVLINKLSQMDSFKYGYLHEFPLEKGPEYYSAGVIMDGMYTQEEENQLGNWFRFRINSKEDKIKKMRDLYPYNLVNHHHLDYNIDNKYTFKELLFKNNIEVENVSADLFGFALSQNQIGLIRDKIKNTGLLISYI